MQEEAIILTDSLRTFLQQPRIAYVSTIDAHGYPHTVPTWFEIDGDDLIFSVLRQRARLKYIQANPKGAVVVGGALGESEGYLFQGEFRILDDADHFWINKIIHRYSADDESAEPLIAAFAPLESVIVRFTPVKVMNVVM